MPQPPLADFAINTGATAEEIQEVLMQAAIDAGSLPLESFRVAEAALRDMADDDECR